MTDTRPPRITESPRATLTSLLKYQRESLARKLDGVSDDNARRSPVGSGTSLLWLVSHMADAELTWFCQRVAGISVELAGALTPNDSVATVLDRYCESCRRADSAISTIAFNAPAVESGGDPVTLAWVMAHMLEETARHAGHADILRELIDGSTGR